VGFDDQLLVTKADRNEVEQALHTLTCAVDDLIVVENALLMATKLQTLIFNEKFLSELLRFLVQESRLTTALLLYLQL
jgi:hypothetical protein